MNKNRGIDVLIALNLLSYSLIYLGGGDSNGYLIYFIVGNASILDFLYGILPMVGILGMVLCLGIKTKLIVYFISFFFQLLPLYFDILLHDRNTIKYRSFFIPAACYLIFIGMGFYLLLKDGKQKTKPNL